MKVNSMLDSFVKSGVIKDNPDFNIFSSIEEPFPRACVTFTTSQITPDALSLYKGKSFPIRVWLTDKTNVVLSNFVVDYFEDEGTSVGHKISVYLRYLQDLCEIVNVRKSYKDKNAYDVLTDILDNDSYLSEFEREIERSDHNFDAFRVLGEGSVDFIEHTVLPTTLVDNCKPKFFMGLDDVIRFLSVNSCTKKGDNIKAYVDLGGHSSISEDAKQKGVNIDKVMIIKADDYKTLCGSSDSTKNIKVKNFIYAPENPYDVKTTTAVTAQLADKDKSKYPISKNLLSFTDATDSKLINNRPFRNVKVETYNELTDQLGSIITIKIKRGILTIPDGVDKLLSPGNQVYIDTTYAYSALNGIYLLKDIEYVLQGGVEAVKMTLIRNFYDMQYPENRDKLEIQGQALYTNSPICDAGDLLG